MLLFMVIFWNLVYEMVEVSYPKRFKIIISAVTFATYSSLLIQGQINVLWDS